MHTNVNAYCHSAILNLNQSERTNKNKQETTNYFLALCMDEQIRSQHKHTHTSKQKSSISDLIYSAEQIEFYYVNFF